MARLSLKYVNSFRDRHGVMRHYFRRPGYKCVPLPGLPGSTEFMMAYEAALDIAPTNRRDIGESRTVHGTVNSLVVGYYQSDEWQNGLSEETRNTRRRIIEAFRERHGEKRVSLLRHENIVKMLAGIRKPSAKRHWLKAIRGLLRFGVPTMLNTDPTEAIPSIKLPKSKGHHSWTNEEIADYRAYWQLGTQQRLVFEFALEAVSRRGEVVRLGPQHIKNGRIRIERIHGSEDVDIPMSTELRAAVDAMPRTHLTFLVTGSGKPRSKVGLGNDFARWATQAGLPPRCRLHGLKKAGMRRLADAGTTTHELMAISGHKTLAEVQRYTQGADRKRLADSGMAKKRDQK